MHKPLPTTLILRYIAYEPLDTAPPFVAPTRPGYRWTWIQNIRVGDLVYWASRGELTQAVFRKRYLTRFWDVAVVVPGPPRATPWSSVEDLCERGIVGLYGWRNATPHIE